MENIAPVLFQDVRERALKARHLIDNAKVVRLEQSLYEFIKAAWHVLEGSNPFQEAEHIRAICLHLEHLSKSREKFSKLCISVPRGFAKSMVTTVLWPAWVWTWRAEAKWLFSSYNEEAVIRDSLRTRQLIKSDWYQSRWPMTIRSDQDNKKFFWLDKGGYRFCTSIGLGSGTGKRADFIVTDDPNKLGKPYDPTESEMVNNAWDNVFAGCANDPRTVVFCVIQQRRDKCDLTGHVMGSDRGYAHLRIPMRFDAANPCVTPIWKDWRTTHGELAWKIRYDEKYVSEWEKTLGLYGSASQLQQEPRDISGGIIKREWFKPEYGVEVMPVECRWVRSIDLAATKDGGCYTSMVLMGATPDKIYYVADVQRGRWDPHDRDTIIYQMALSDRQKYPFVRIVFEKEGGASGVQVMQSFRKLLTGFSVWENHVSDSKPIRAMPFASQLGGGNVRWLKDAPWLSDWIEELVAFPLSEYADQMDATSQAFLDLSNATTAVPASGMPAGRVVTAGKPVNGQKPLGPIGLGKAAMRW